MKIVITTPDFSLHGGIRVILEWANRLTQWHEVFLYSIAGGRSTWFELSPKVKLMQTYHVRDKDCLIITSPHSIDLVKRNDCPKKVFLFMQMAEHLFKDHYLWLQKCREFYTASYPMFLISKWNQQLIEDVFGRRETCHYIGNGVNLDHFPICTKAKLNNIVLVEGWNSLNPSKDVQHLSAKVCKRLKDEGFYIIAYAQQNPHSFADVPNEFYVKPSLQKMNELYERATILIKATRYDARSCAPMEAMTKGTVTARAIIHGDDDLIHDKNCLLSDYNEERLYLNARRLLKDVTLREQLAQNCIDYIQTYTWDYWMSKVNDILCSSHES